MSDYNNNTVYTRGNTTTYTTQPNANKDNTISGLNLTLLGSGVVVAMVIGVLYYLSSPIKHEESKSKIT